MSWKSPIDFEYDEKYFDKRKYIKYLFQYLGSKYCFVSGSFVIEDSERELFNYFYNDEKKLELSGPLRSHVIYNQFYEEENNKEFALYESRFNPLTISCACKYDEYDEYDEYDNTMTERTFASCKWYKFKEKGKQFFFLKPEDNPTFSAKHAIGAFSRYMLRIGNKSCKKPRREDCKDKCKFKQEVETFENYSKIGKPTFFGNEEIVKEEYTRKGDEAYIPQIISNYILTFMKMTLILFKYVDSENKVILNYSFDNIDKKKNSGGKSKKRRIVKRRTYKKK